MIDDFAQSEDEEDDLLALLADDWAMLT